MKPGERCVASTDSDPEPIVVQIALYGEECQEDYQALLNDLVRHGCELHLAKGHQEVTFPPGTLQEKLVIRGHYLLRLPDGLEVAQMGCGARWFLFIQQGGRYVRSITSL